MLFLTNRKTHIALHSFAGCAIHTPAPVLLSKEWLTCISLPDHRDKRHALEVSQDRADWRHASAGPGKRGTPSLPTRLEQTQSKRNYQQEAVNHVARKPRLALTPFDPAM